MIKINDDLSFVITQIVLHKLSLVIDKLKQNQIKIRVISKQINWSESDKYRQPVNYKMLLPLEQLFHVPTREINFKHFVSASIVEDYERNTL